MLVRGGLTTAIENPHMKAASQGGVRMAAKEGYCVKCKAKKEIQDAKEITMKNGRPATQGLCPDCGTKIFKIGK